MSSIWDHDHDTSEEEGPPLSDFIKQTDEAKACPKPSNIGKFHIEEEHEAAEEEQRQAHKERGEREAGPYDERAAGLKHEADSTTTISDHATEHERNAWDTYHGAWIALHGFVRRKMDAKWMTYVFLLLFFGGDVAGIGGAALLMGEQPFNAIFQAVSASAATIAFGVVGREWRYEVLAGRRQTDPKQLAPALKPYAQYFSGPQVDGLVQRLSLVCLGGVCIIATGVFALRDSTEGLIAGIAFGGFALALGLASMANSFAGTDDLAEMLDQLFAHATKTSNRAQAIRSSPAIREHGAAVARAGSIRTAATAAGEAAAYGVRRRLHWALNNSPGVAGNGTAARRTSERAKANGHYRGRRVPRPDQGKA